MKDQLRELLFPLTIIVIVASLYSMAMAHANEKVAHDIGHPNLHALTDEQAVAAVNVDAVE